VTPLDANTDVQLAEFIPDFVVRDGQVYTRSTQIENPAVHLVVNSKNPVKAVNVWLPPIEGFEENASSPYKFQAKDLKMAYFTGLQVSHEPGQWAVWAGVLLMALGLASVFYVVHVRYWAVPLRNARGEWVLWLGGAANRNQDAFQVGFNNFVELVRESLPQPAAAEDLRASADHKDQHSLASV
ncbi:MAG: cytochrome c biogenesis protein ResB, partial [Acidobacteriales bacterium]|nr:cytochrome c biogenesis protein ResB [Terriglobales bacterium]